MLTLDEAEQLIAANVKPLAPQTLEVAASLGLMLAAPARATLTQPQWPQVAMDGYALSLADNATGPWPLQDAIAAAGDATATLAPGAALRVTTGSPLPRGADTVVMQENTACDGRQVRLTEAAQSGANIRPAGQDFHQGDIVAHPGQCITAGSIATLLHAGVATLQVYPRPRLGIIITGSELTRDGAPLSDGKTPDTNGPFLRAWTQLRNLPCTLRHCGEDPAELADLVMALAPEVDIFVVCGGASVGPRDGSHAGLLGAGARCIFSKVAQKPGKPMALYQLGDKPVLLLPGNPAAVFCGAQWHLEHIVRATQGLQAPHPISLRIQGSCPRVGTRTLLLRAQVTQACDGRLDAHILEGQLSHLLGNLPQCDALLRLDPGQSAAPGSVLPGVLLRGAQITPR